MVVREMLPRNRPSTVQGALLEVSVVLLDIFLWVQRVRIPVDVQALDIQSWFALLDENVLGCLEIFISRTREKKKKNHTQSL